MQPITQPPLRNDSLPSLAIDNLNIQDECPPTASISQGPHLKDTQSEDIVVQDRKRRYSIGLYEYTKTKWEDCQSIIDSSAGGSSTTLASENTGSEGPGDSPSIAAASVPAVH